MKGRWANLEILVLVLSVGVAMFGVFSLSAQLRETQRSLHDTERSRRAAEDMLAVRLLEVEQLSSKASGAISALSTTTIRYNELEASYTQLLADQEVAVRRHDELAKHVETLTSELDDARVEITQILADREEQGDVLLSITTHRDMVVNDYSELKQQVGSVQHLQGQANHLAIRIDSLESEILDLEEQRKPLLLTPRVTPVLCTGSMEPAITCLDRITLLRDFQPSDIVVGAIISYRRPPACAGVSNWVLHRVTQIKVEDGTRHYRTKGDASEIDDKCWIPETAVFDYLIGIDKNTTIENQQLRGQVNHAQRVYATTQAAYLSKYAEYCGEAPSGTCVLPEKLHVELVSLHYWHTKALDKYSCWLESAKTAVYSAGSPTVYTPCI